MTALNLGFDLQFNDLYAREGLEKVDAAFVAELKSCDVELYNRFLQARTSVQASAEGEVIDAKEEAQLIIDLAPLVEDFIGKTFNIQGDVRKSQQDHTALADLYLCKRIFVQRRAVKMVKADEGDALDGDALQAQLETLFGEPLTEKSFAKNVVQWIDGTKGVDLEGCEDKTAIAGKYAGWALLSKAGRIKHKYGILFKKPNKTDYESLVPVDSEVIDGVTVMRLADCHSLRERDGFNLTDNGFSLEEVLDQANYCIYCHKQGKDSCAKGLREKPDENGNAPYKTSPTRVKQAGCPLEEKISEMNMIKAQGYTIGALGIITVDNPLCAATGHRICNDCMKGCIYQKQDPVNIPAVETRCLTDVLAMPWGFEIYSLLTRWNPLNLRAPLPKKESGYKVLVAGLGPAGFALSHHLMNDGHTVVGVDGLKIEPLPTHLAGVSATGERSEFTPIKNIETELYESLDDRVLAGFGGVAEYGITVRWNKNFLKVIRLILERRAQFAMYGGVRFGSTITYDQAFELGFDHVALCLGAGRPTVVSMPNALSRGVRTASDFLMALQLSGAAKKDSIANIHVRLPVVVIGGGLTGIDAATESLAYYPVQVEKFLARFEVLCKEQGEDFVRSLWTEEEAETAEEFIAHGKAIRVERVNAAAEGRDADVISLLKSWGGATLAYRRRLQDAPSYRLNHEEVEKAMEEGITFTENVTPVRVHLDEYGHAKGLRVSYPKTMEDERIDVTETTLPARTIFMAAGTNPNTVLGREDEKHFKMDHDGWFFQSVDLGGNIIEPEKGISKPEVVNVLMSKNDNGKFVSFFGDLHPTFVGNVVKALGSAKQGYPLVTQALGQKKPATDEACGEFISKLNAQLIATVHKVERLTPTILEVVMKAPMAAKNFQPGQFYRVQNFESLAMKVGDHAELDVSNDISVQVYDAKYRPEMIALHKKALAEVGIIYDDEQACASLDIEDSRFFLAGKGDKLVGFVALQNKSAIEASVRSMRVDYDYHGQGIGTLLMSTLEKFARLQGYTTLTLDSDATRTKAHDFYVRHNYAKIEKEYAGEYTSPHIAFEKRLSIADATTLAMEGLALTGAWHDKEKGLVSVIILEMGGSADLCAHLQVGEPLVLMGPTGEPTEIEKDETVMLLGGGLGNAVLFSIGKAFRDAGSKVLYFAGYKEMHDRYKIEEIEKAADVIVWCCDNGEFPVERPQDKTFHGNIVQAIKAYGSGELGEQKLKTTDCDRIITIGSDRMMAAIKSSRFNALKDYLKPKHKALGSINSPMQCMMKEICAQCLQRHIDPETGERYYVYSCYNQDQDMDYVDFQHLNERLKQNTVQEKLTKLWIDRSLKSLGLRETAEKEAA